MYDNVLSQHWDYKFTLSIFMNNTLAILPKTNLVSNIGDGVNATNCKTEGPFHNLPTNEMRFPLLHPKRIYKLHWADYETERMCLATKQLWSGKSQSDQPQRGVLESAHPEIV